jgi:heme/copper-type cytochrome/quinol oxidase subunit 4
MTLERWLLLYILAALIFIAYVLVKSYWMLLTIKDHQNRGIYEITRRMDGKQETP